jgi:hypothetical protein
VKDSGQILTRATTQQFKNPLSTIKNPIEILDVPMKKFQDKTKLIKTKVIAKFQSL